MAAVNTLVLASGNAGKLREFNQLLSSMVRPVSIPLGMAVSREATRKITKRC